MAERADAAAPPRTAFAVAGGVAIPATLFAMVSFQTGASIAKELFPILGPGAMVCARIGVAALAMCLFARPRLARLRGATLLRLLPYGVALAGMNSAFYLSLTRLPLGLAVAIEFTGPLLVALAASRRPADLGVVVLVVGGLWLLLGPQAASASPDARGAAWALLAGLCWAIYIVAGHRVGQVLPAASGAALGMLVALATVLPFTAPSLGAFARHPALVAPACAVALLSSALPYTLEMMALRRLGPRVFGVLMSVEPAVAALAGAVLLGEQLSARSWAGIACVVAASFGAALRPHTA